jgi:ABC-type transport system involved in cytochrome c biogenesis permease subunit
MNPAATIWRLLALLCLVAAAGCSRANPEVALPLQRTEPWSPEFVAQMATLPLQHEGRVKPFQTLAAFTLYFVHGRRDMKFQYGETTDTVVKVTLDPTEWLLDVWAFPEQAAKYPLFRIEHSGVLDALGIANDGQSFNLEYVSYDRLIAKSDQLGELARKYADIEQRLRNPVQEHIVQLWSRLRTYHNLHMQLAAWHDAIAIEGEGLQKALGGSKVRLGELLQRAGELRGFVRTIGQEWEDPKHGNLMAVMSFLEQAIQSDRGPLLLPPVLPPEQTDTWHSLAETIDLTLRNGAPEQHVAMVGMLQRGVAGASLAEREQGFLGYRDAVVAAAERRDEYGKVSLEAYYHRASWHYQSIHWFVFGFILAALCWLWPRNKPLWYGSMAATVAALAMLTADITLRSIVRGRPPITNLYDTFLFIAAVGVLVAWIAEWIVPRRIALAVGPFLGAVLVMCARLFEVSDGQDTMKQLVAVLDSNFWLATHVTTINIGYAAGLLAAVLANGWVLIRVLRIANPSEPMAKSVVRMIYGVTAFSLVFGVVGTILGGVWANDSWGRFWGWDPKENGALMICLSQIAMLHARFTGWIRDFGMVIWSSVTGMVVMFSWFHVNLLQVGLHSYGFSAGLRNAVWITYTVELVMMAIGAIDVLLRPNPVRRSAAAEGDAGAPAEPA